MSRGVKALKAPSSKKKTIDERFEEVAQAFVEQRDFTIFCFQKLRRNLRMEIRLSEGRLTRRLDRHEVTS